MLLSFEDDADGKGKKQFDNFMSESFPIIIELDNDSLEYIESAADWCAKMYGYNFFGDSDINSKDVDRYEMQNEFATWDYYCTNFYFKNSKDAAMFKLVFA